MEAFLPWLMLLVSDIPGQGLRVERLPGLSISLEECEARGRDEVGRARRSGASSASVHCIAMPPETEVDAAWQRMKDDRQHGAAQ